MNLATNPDRISRSYDAVVVGSGISGGWAAKELGEAGLKVLVLEAGPHRALRPRSEYAGPERESRAVTRQKIQAQHAAFWDLDPDLFVDDNEHPYVQGGPERFLWIRGRQVGGRSLTWGGVTLRFSDYEFQGQWDESEAAAWPFRYRDLCPYYDYVEGFLGVQGTAEGLPQLPDGVCLGHSGLTGAELRFKQIVERQWRDRKVIPGRGIAPSRNADRAEWPRTSNLGTTLKAAIAIGKVVIASNRAVSHLITERDGTVSGVAVVDTESGKSSEVRARFVILAASAIESVRILLNSKCARHPNGVGNANGLLGRFLLDHAVIWVNGPLATDRSPEPHRLGGPDSIIIPRYRNLHARECDFAGGFGIWGGMQRGESEGFWFLHALTEMQPQQTNRITVDESVRDCYGIPAARVSVSYSADDAQMIRSVIRDLWELSQSAGLTISQSGRTYPGQYVHELGGARMGSRPETSVLNGFNQCWDAPNVLVVDGACFASAGWQNPALTIMAITVRACRHLVQRQASHR